MFNPYLRTKHAWITVELFWYFFSLISQLELGLLGSLPLSCKHEENNKKCFKLSVFYTNEKTVSWTERAETHSKIFLDKHFVVLSHICSKSQPIGREMWPVEI